MTKSSCYSERNAVLWYYFTTYHVTLNEWHQISPWEGCWGKARGANKETQEGKQTKKRSECCLEKTVGWFGVHF